MMSMLRAIRRKPLEEMKKGKDRSSDVTEHWKAENRWNRILCKIENQTVCNSQLNCVKTQRSFRGPPFATISSLSISLIAYTRPGRGFAEKRCGARSLPFLRQCPAIKVFSSHISNKQRAHWMSIIAGSGFCGRACSAGVADGVDTDGVGIDGGPLTG